MPSHKSSSKSGKSKQQLPPPLYQPSERPRASYPSDIPTANDPYPYSSYSPYPGSSSASSSASQPYRYHSVESDAARIPIEPVPPSSYASSSSLAQPAYDYPKAPPPYPYGQDTTIKTPKSKTSRQSSVIVHNDPFQEGRAPESTPSITSKHRDGRYHTGSAHGHLPFETTPSSRDADRERRERRRESNLKERDGRYHPKSSHDTWHPR